jgi:transportin-1
MIPSVIQQIEPEPEPERISVCNNAAWATGEIALQCVGDSSVIEPFIPELMNRLCTILLNPKSQKSLAENAAVTIGRLGLVTPALIAPQLPQFAQAWCTALWEIKDNEEKDSAFRGFCMMIAANPSGIQDVSRKLLAGYEITDNLQSFMWFCNAVCKWQHPSGHLDAMFRQILQGYKSSLGAGWEQLASSFPPVLRQRLRERYEV